MVAFTSFPVRMVGAAVSIGLSVGISSLAITETGRIGLINAGTSAAVAVGSRRARPPQPGDTWAGCNDARNAGSAPIYRGEPGYRSDMDGDDDGIACEPIN